MGIWANRAISFVQQQAKQAGITLIKNSRYEQEWDISGALLAEAASAERERRKLAVGVTGVVFSFNRPVQLHLLLASYYRHVTNPAKLVVQYGAKGEAFEAGYEAVAREFPQVEFVRENGFRATLLDVLGRIGTRSLFYLVDDIVFTRPMDMAELAKLDPTQVIACLRLGRTITYSYTTQMQQDVPMFRDFGSHKELVAFTWGEQGNHWDYPMSVDGNVFDTAEMTVMSRVLPYKAPNTYEGSLMRFAPVMRKRPGVCFALPRLMNIPCNKVQDEVENKAGDISPEYLLAQWNEGMAIDPAPLDSYPNVGPHEEVAFTFVKRGGKTAKATLKPATATKPAAKAKAAPKKGKAA